MSVKTNLRKPLSKLGAGKARRKLEGLTARYHLRKNVNRIKGNDILRVAFVVYDPAMWDKQESVFMELQTRKNVQASLIVVLDTSIKTVDEQQKKYDFLLVNTAMCSCMMILCCRSLKKVHINTPSITHRILVSILCRCVP